MHEDTRVVQLIGPGGAGKTTVGRAVAARLGWLFVDLDQQFMAREGEIASYIAAHGYLGYARRNVEIHRELRRTFTTAAVYALSSGFMTYPADEIADYSRTREAVEREALTLLLLPSFELEACVEVIVRRQLARPYLGADRAREEARLRERFPIFMALQCARLRSDRDPDQIAPAVISILFPLPPAPGTSA